MKILIQESLIPFELDLSELDVDQQGQLNYRRMLSEVTDSSEQLYEVNI